MEDRDDQDCSSEDVPSDRSAWPDYLEIAIADALEPVALKVEFDGTARQIRATAREQVQGFAGAGGISRGELEGKLSLPEIAGITGLLFLYALFIADITIAVVRIQQALEGAPSATANKFSS